MNMNESIRNRRKKIEKIRGYSYKITYMSTANYCRLQTLYQIQVETLHFDKMIKFTNYLNRFMNINEYLRNKRKFVET